MWLRLIYVFVGGGIGALLRYSMSGLIQKQSSGIFPYGTLAVNLIGALFIGFLWELFQHINVSTNIRIFILVGLIGALTTFSTFSLETMALLKDKEYAQALINVVFNNISCLILVFLGSAATRLIIRFLNKGRL